MYGIPYTFNKWKLLLIIAIIISFGKDYVNGRTSILPPLIVQEDLETKFRCLRLA